MSSSSVCQGFQSCMEPSISEPQILRLKLAPPSSLSESQEKSNNTNDESVTKMDKNADMGGWGFLLSLKKTEAPQNVYVHPAQKHSSSMLTGKSLEMCTESLGSETGSDNASQNMDELDLLSSENSNTCFSKHTSEPSKSNTTVSRRMKRSNSFPPPLTSITDLGGVQVRPHREDGRLILEAVATPSVQPCFQAQRSNGRLTLTMFQTFISDGDDDDDEEEQVADEEEQEEEKVEEEGGFVGDQDADDAEEIVDDEFGKRKLARPGRCKESGNRNNNAMPNWKLFWVAT